jgi:hypothetical protein
MEESERRANVYARTLFSAQPNTWRCLVGDRPDDALVAIDRALEGWPRDDYYLTKLYVQMARVITLLYLDRNEEARDLQRYVREQMRQNLMDQIPYIVGEVERYRGMTALRVGDHAEVRRCARKLEKMKVHCSVGVALLFRAVLAAGVGERDEAARLQLRGIQMVEDAEYQAIAQAARHRLGVFLGEREGQRLRDEARAWFVSQGVKQVEKLVAVLAPEIPSTLTLARRK